LKECAVDISAKVRTAALSALGALGDRSLAAFFRQRFEAEDSYLAQSEALRSLGKAGGAEDLPFLQRVTATQSPGGLIARAAESAIQSIEKRR
jgi:HEAT repeat protein